VLSSAPLRDVPFSSVIVQNRPASRAGVVVASLQTDTAMKFTLSIRWEPRRKLLALSVHHCVQAMMFAALLAALPTAEVTVTTAHDEDNGGLDEALGNGKGTSLREAILYAPTRRRRAVGLPQPQCRLKEQLSRQDEPCG